MDDEARHETTQPLDDEGRRRAFFLTAAVILVALALAITLLGGDDEGDTEPVEPAAPPVAVGPPPQEEAEPVPGPGPVGTTSLLPPDDLAGPAQEFGEQYMLAAYGEGPANRIEHAVPALRRGAAREAAAQPESREGLRPRVTEVRADRLDRRGNAYLVTIIVDDGGPTNPYPRGFEFRLRNGRWLAVDYYSDESH